LIQDSLPLAVVPLERSVDDALKQRRVMFILALLSPNRRQLILGTTQAPDSQRYCRRIEGIPMLL